MNTSIHRRLAALEGPARRCLSCELAPLNGTPAAPCQHDRSRTLADELAELSSSESRGATRTDHSTERQP